MTHFCIKIVILNIMCMSVQKCPIACPQLPIVGYLRTNDTFLYIKNIFVTCLAIRWWSNKLFLRKILVVTLSWPKLSESAPLYLHNCLFNSIIHILKSQLILYFTHLISFMCCSQSISCIKFFMLFLETTSSQLVNSLKRAAILFIQ